MKVALLPLDNLSSDKDARRLVLPLLREQLEEKGVELVDDDDLMRILLRERVRSMAYISTDLSRKIARELNAGAVFTGAITLFSVSSMGVPHVGLTARLIDTADNSIIWSGEASATGDDFATILGLGRIKSTEKLAPKVVSRALRWFDVRPLSRQKELLYRIAVMPFANTTRYRAAGAATTYLYLSELSRNPHFETIEYGDIRKAIVDFRIRSGGGLDRKKREELSARLGADLILLGSVETYAEGTGTSPPKVEIYARVLDARSGRILWLDTLYFRDRSVIIAFDWSETCTLDSAASDVISGLVDKMEAGTGVELGCPTYCPTE